MDKLDLIKAAITVAGKCADCTSAADAAKTVATGFLPNLIDFIDERATLARAARVRAEEKKAREEASQQALTSVDDDTEKL